MLEDLETPKITQQVIPSLKYGHARSRVYTLSLYIMTGFAYTQTAADIGEYNYGYPCITFFFANQTQTQIHLFCYKTEEGKKNRDNTAPSQNYLNI